MHYERYEFSENKQKLALIYPKSDMSRQHMPKKPKTVANTGIERFKGARNTNNQTLLPTNYAIF